MGQFILARSSYKFFLEDLILALLSLLVGYFRQVVVIGHVILVDDYFLLHQPLIIWLSSSVSNVHKYRASFWPCQRQYAWIIIVFKLNLNFTNTILDLRGIKYIKDRHDIVHDISKVCHNIVAWQFICIISYDLPFLVKCNPIYRVFSL